MDIDYTKTDQDEVREELISLLKRTKTFKDASFTGSSLYDLSNNMSYVAALYGFYLNQIANEPFINSTKQYKNINRISNSLSYNPIGKASARVNIASSLSKEYVLRNTEGFIEIPAYSLFPSSKSTNTGKNFSFTNKTALSVQIKQFGVNHVKEWDVKYVGEILDTGLDPTKIEISAFTKNPIHFVDPEENVITFEETIRSYEDVDLNNFKIGITYSMFLRKISNSYFLVIGNRTIEIADDEIARFHIDDARKVIFDQNFTSNRLYKGRLGFRNLEHVNIRAISYPGVDNSVGRVEMVIPKFSPAFQVLYNGETFSFSSVTKDIVISSDRIEGSYFADNKDVAVTLQINNVSLENYGAKLGIKKLSETIGSDVIIAIIPGGSGTTKDSRGNLILEENQFLKGDTKTGSVKFTEGETIKRVVFEEPYEFGLPTAELTLASPKNYAVQLYVNDNLVTFYSEKTTRGFKIHIEDGIDFTGEVYWKAISYEKSIVQTSKVDSGPYLEGIDPSNYAVMVQPDKNANIWVSDVTEYGFSIDTDTALLGNVDFLIIPNKDFSSTPEPKEVGQVYVSKGEIEIEVKFNRSRVDTNYQLFLQPNGNVRAWFSNKTTDGFILNVEPETDFFGIVDWQLYVSEKSGTTFFDGANGFVSEPTLIFQDLPETTNLGFVEQGVVKMSKIDTSGLVSRQVNSLKLDYNTDIVLNTMLSYVIKNSNISYNNIRVFVGSDDETWVEYKNADEYKRRIDKNSNVFYVRINKDKNIGITFGNNDFKGKDPKGKQIIILGMETVGAEGNIAKGILSESVISSFNFQTTDIVTSSVASSFIDFLGIKQDVFFNGQRPVILDYKGDSIDNTSLKIVQLDNAYNGSEPESLESVRTNAQFSYRSQKRLVSKEDYEQAILNEFSGIIDEVRVFNYKEVGETNLFDLGDNPERYYNTLFFLVVPSFGKGMTFLQRQSVKDFIGSDTNKVTTTESEIVEPTFIEIDVVILYTVSQNASAIVARNDILTGVYEFFERKNRKLGETITISSINSAISQENISGLEIQLKRDDNSDFSASDYDVDITPDEYEDAFEEVANKKLDDAVKRELRNLIGKGLVELKQPLFDVQKPNGDREWLFVNDISLGRFEFPVLGDVVIERKV